MAAEPKALRGGQGAHEAKDVVPTNKVGGFIVANNPGHVQTPRVEHVGQLTKNHSVSEDCHQRLNGGVWG